MTTLVDADTGEKVAAVVLMSVDEAREITGKIQGYASALCHLVKRAHDGGAWKVLGYPSWAAYCASEFDVSRSYAYRLVSHAEKIMELTAAAGLPEVSPMGDTLPERATRNLDVDAATDAITDAVADLPDDATDEQRLDAAMGALADLKPAEDQDEPPTSDLDAEPEQDAPSPAPAPTPDQDAASSAGAGQSEGEGSAALPLGASDDEWQRYAALLVQAHALTSEDPVAVVAAMTDADREVWCVMADDLGDWAHRFGQAVIEANPVEDQ